jgi:adenylate kinase family enzyme
MRRINVVGTSSSGKSTFARRLAERLNTRYIELDALHWEPNWIEAPDDVMRERVEAATQSDDWVVDGNYAAVRDIVWGRADAIVWLDYPLRTILGWWARRTARRVFTREELWNGNRETITQLVGRESLLWWILSTYRRRRREYPELLAKRPRLVAVRLRSPRGARAWLDSLAEKRA